MEEAPSTGDAPRAGQLRRLDGAGGHARGGSSSPREDEAEVEPATGTWPLSARDERRGSESAAGRTGERRQGGRMGNAGGRRGERWPLAGVRCASRPRRPLLHY